MLLGIALSVSVIVIPHDISAKTLDTLVNESNLSGYSNPHFKLGQNPNNIAIDDTPDNKVYVANPDSRIVSVIDVNYYESFKFSC
jgi:hypothetical protein